MSHSFGTHQRLGEWNREGRWETEKVMQEKNPGPWVSSRENDEKCSALGHILEVKPIGFADRAEVADKGKKKF